MDVAVDQVPSRPPGLASAPAGVRSACPQPARVRRRAPPVHPSRRRPGARREAASRQRHVPAMPPSRVHGKESKQEASPVAARPSEVLRHTRARGAYRHLGVSHSLALPWELRRDGPWVRRVATSGLGVGNLGGGRARCWRARPEEVHLPLDAPPHPPPPHLPVSRSPALPVPESLRRPLCPAAWGLTASRAPG